MVKKVLISLPPKQVKDILNGVQDILVRRFKPNSFQGTVYICVNKTGGVLVDMGNGVSKKERFAILTNKDVPSGEVVNQKVVAKFTLNKCVFVKDKGHFKWYIEDLVALKEILPLSRFAIINKITNKDTGYYLEERITVKTTPSTFTYVYLK